MNRQATRASLAALITLIAAGPTAAQKPVIPFQVIARRLSRRLRCSLYADVDAVLPGGGAMLARRHFLSLAPFGTVFGRTAGDREGGTADVSDQTMRDLVRAVEQIRIELQVHRTELDAVREPQKLFLKTNGKFPDFIDVGIDVWYRVYDWHLKWQQPLQIGRDSSGRYTMTVMTTTLVMRPDALPNFVSIPYDNK